MMKKNKIIRISEFFKNVDYAIFKFPLDENHNPSDIDILVSDIKKAVKILKHNGFVILHNKEPYKIMMVNPETDEILHIHEKISWNGVEYFNSSQALNEKKEVYINNRRLYFLSPEWEFISMCAHSLFENKIIKKWEKEKIKKMFKIIDYNRIKKMFPWTKYIIRSIIKKKEKISIITQLIAAPSKIKLIKTWFSNLILKEKKKIICITGPDGVGKTTQTNILKKRLHKYGVNISSYWGRTGPLTQLLLKKRLTPLLPIAIIIDSWYIYIKLILSNFEVIILDRCGIDMIADYIYLSGNYKNLSKLMKLIPKYTLVVILDTKPEVLMIRNSGKPIHISKDLNIIFHKKQRNIYKKIAKKYNFFVISTNKRKISITKNILSLLEIIK